MNCAWTLFSLQCMALALSNEMLSARFRGFVLHHHDLHYKVVSFFRAGWCRRSGEIMDLYNFGLCGTRLPQFRCTCTENYCQGDRTGRQEGSPGHRRRWAHGGISLFVMFKFTVPYCNPAFKLAQAFSRAALVLKDSLAYFPCQAWAQHQAW